MQIRKFEQDLYLANLAFFPNSLVFIEEIIIGLDAGTPIKYIYCTLNYLS